MIITIVEGKQSLKYENPLTKKHQTKCNHCDAIVQYSFKDIDVSRNWRNKIVETRLNSCPWCHKVIVLEGKK